MIDRKWLLSRIGRAYVACERKGIPPHEMPGRMLDSVFNAITVYRGVDAESYRAELETLIDQRLKREAANE